MTRMPTLAAAASLALAGCAQTPPGLEPPPVELPMLTLYAAGVQVYECRATPAGAEWTFVAPEADLYDAAGAKVGRHYAGPTWELRDGGRATATVAARAPAKSGESIPWLLLKVRDPAQGTLAAASSIQRLDTIGGAAPTQGCNAAVSGVSARVPYAARYVFFAPRRQS